MIYAIYLKRTSKPTWSLVSISSSIETIFKDLEDIKKKCNNEGLLNFKLATKIYETSFYIPQSLKTLISQEIKYN